MGRHRVPRAHVDRQQQHDRQGDDERQDERDA